MTDPKELERLAEQLERLKRDCPCGSYLLAEAADAISSLLAQLRAVGEERDEALKESAELTKALTGLTCGGSEFFVRKGERYVADIPACVNWVRRSKEDAHRRTVDAITARNASKEQVRVLLGAIQQAVNLIVALKDGRARFLLENTLAEVDALAPSSVPPQGGEEGRHPGASPSAGPQAATAPSDAEPSAQGEQP